MPGSTDQEPSFKQKVLIVALVVVIIWIIKATFSVLLLILAGAMLALYFRGLSGLLHRKLHLTTKITLPVAVIGSLLLLVGFFYLAGNEINHQVQQLSDTLPATIDNAKRRLSETALGNQIVERVSSRENVQKATATIQSFFRTTFGVLGDVYIVLFIGIFFTVSPNTYIKGFLSLFTSGARPKAKNVTHQVGSTLTKWLKGKLFAMLVVAVLTSIGLKIIDVPMAFILAIIAGLLNFIPNFGPLIAMVPAALVGLLQGPTTALLIIGLYLLVQFLESNLITPQIQKKLIQIPPALIIIAQLFMGVFAGGWGLILATPVVAILITVVKELWVKKQQEDADGEKPEQNKKSEKT